MLIWFIVIKIELKGWIYIFTMSMEYNEFSFSNIDGHFIWAEPAVSF